MIEATSTAHRCRWTNRPQAENMAHLLRGGPRRRAAAVLFEPDASLRGEADVDQCRREVSSRRGQTAALAGRKCVVFLSAAGRPRSAAGNRAERFGVQVPQIRW